MTARRHPAAAPAADIPSPSTAPATLPTPILHIVHTVSIPQLADLLVLLGGSTIPETLVRIETAMSAFANKLDKLEATLDAFDAREAKEDEEFVLSKAEVTKLTKELADLQAKIEAEKATPEEEARFQAIVDRIDRSNKISSEVLPEPAPEPTPEPAPEPTPEPAPTEPVPAEGGDTSTTTAGTTPDGGPTIDEVPADGTPPAA